MKKKVLIVIHSLGCGGAEKSLISFLKFLPATKWNVDLLIGDQHGMFMKDIPDYVNVLKDNHAFENYSAPFKRRRKKVCSANDLLCQLRWHMLSPFQKDMMRGELRWKLWGQYLPQLQGEYDLAISYMNGYPNYYVIDKVHAKKKILWVHNEFEKLGYDYRYEYRFYKAADRIVTISQSCVDSILRIYPEFAGKVVVLENISSPTAIRTMAKDIPEDPFFSYGGIRLLSVGRLNQQKRFDLAINAAKIMQNEGVEFLWYILGDGELRTQLQELVTSNGLEGKVVLAGIKDNPYPYIAQCDIFVQSSEYEGKSIVLDEAKILCRPIVVTNYPTVYSSIRDGVNGIVVDLNEKAIAEALISMIADSSLRNELASTLKQDHVGNETEIMKYLDLFNGLIQ